MKAGDQGDQQGPTLDNTGATAKNGDGDYNRWESRPTTNAGGCHPEPLDEATQDCYGLQQPIAATPDIVDKERYLTDSGDPMTHFQAVGSYIEQRHSEGTTATRHGWTKGRQYYAKQQYRRGMAIDRQLLVQYQNPTTVLFSLRIEPAVVGRLTLLAALKTAADATIEQLRYRLQGAADAPFSADEWEYIAVFAGTERRATPHIHIYCWVDGDITRDRLTQVTEKFVDKCSFAPDDGTGNESSEGAVKIRGNGDDDVPRTDEGVLCPTNCEYEGENSQGAVYVLTQLPHLQDVDEMARDELLHSATTDAWSGSPYRASVGDSRIDERFLAVAPV